VQENEIPVLRWVFVRHTERLQCELSLDNSHLLYELRTRRLGVVASEVIEHYVDSSQAFHRQSDLERGLLEDGWSMETFEKRQVELH
jgi:hypothetical protein